MEIKKLQNQKGQSIVQVLVSIAIMGILLVAMTSMQTTMSRENRALSEKLAALDLERVVTQSLAHTSVCTSLLDTANLVNPGQLPIPNAAAISATNPYRISLKTIGGATRKVAALGESPSAMSNSLKVHSTGGIQLVLTSPTVAELRVTFDQNDLVRSITNLTFPLMITTDLPTSPTTISVSGCGSGLTTTPICTSTRYDSPVGSPAPAGRHPCPSSKQLMVACTTLLYPSGSHSCGSSPAAGIDALDRAYCLDAGCHSHAGQFWGTTVTCCSW